MLQYLYSLFWLTILQYFLSYIRNYNILCMTDNFSRKFSAKSSLTIENNHKNIQDPSIAAAVAKFTTLNNQYQVDHKPTYFLQIQNTNQKSFSNKGKANDTSIMARLRHLENVAIMNQANQEISKRNHKSKTSLPLRKRKNWLKQQNILNQPYLKIYNNFLVQQQFTLDNSQHFSPNNINRNESKVSALCESQSSQKDLSFKQMQKVLIFSKELKPYKKIIQYAKQKNKEKQEFEQIDQKQKKMKYNLEQLHSSKKSSFYQTYTQIAKRTLFKQQMKKKQSRPVSAQLLLQRHFSKIYKRKNTENDVSIGSPIKKSQTNFYLQPKENKSSKNQVKYKKLSGTVLQKSKTQQNERQNKYIQNNIHSRTEECLNRKRAKSEVRK